MNRILVTPVDYYRDFDQSNDRDIVVIKPAEITEVTVQPVRHQVAERITEVEIASATNANYGPYGIGAVKLLPDKTGFVFAVDARSPAPPDDQHSVVFHADYHSVTFVVRYYKLGRPAGKNPPREGWGYMGLHITTREPVSDVRRFSTPGDDDD